MKKSWLILALAIAMLLTLTPWAVAEEGSAALSADITWNDPTTGEQPGTLTLNPADETWTIHFSTPFGAYDIGGTYEMNVTMELTQDGGLGEYLDTAPIFSVMGGAIHDLYQQNVRPLAEAAEQADPYTAEISWDDPITGSQPATLHIDPDTEQWAIHFSTPFGDYDLGGTYTVEGDSVTMEITNDGGLGAYLPADGIKGAGAPAILDMYKASGLLPVYSVDIAWEDAVTGQQPGTLTIDASTEQWTLQFSTPFGGYDLGGVYTVSGETVTMEITNDGGLGAYLPVDGIKGAGEPAILEIYKEHHLLPIYSADIAWEDAVTGQQPGTLTIDASTEQWTLHFSTPFGDYDLGGTYTIEGSSVTMEITNDGGLGAYLPADSIKGAGEPAILAIYQENGLLKQYTADISWEDAITGEQPGTLTIDASTEQWTLHFSTPFGDYDLGGTYTIEGDTVTMEITNDGGLGAYLPADGIKGAGEPAIVQIYAENNITAQGHIHKWSNGVCKVCGTACEHEWNNGVCKICGWRCTHPDHDPHTLVCNDCGLLGYHTFVDGVCTCGNTSIFEYDALPEEYKQENAQAGTVVEFTYDTYAYNAEGVAGEQLNKRAYVYLPYGYDESKAYDILYLLHGGGEDEGSWFNIGEHDGAKGVNTLHLLDNAIANGICDPVIVVTPTFNGNGTDSFWAEMKNELIPGIESVYATYAKGDVSAENLKETRSHRAFAGFSMGSMTSLQSAMAHCTDIFGYIGSYSAGLQHTDLTEEALLDMVRAAGNPLYYWYNGNGFADMAHDDHLNTWLRMAKLGGDMFTDGVNACWVDLPLGTHDWPSWEIDLYNCLQVFFRVDEAGEAPALDALIEQGALH